MLQKLQYISPSRSQVSQLLFLMKRSVRVLRSNDPLRMAGATAFFTTFALPPIVIILTQIFGVFADPQIISSELIGRLAKMLGNRSAHQIENTLIAVKALGQNWYVIIFGFLFLLFVATTLFAVIKNSLEQIWNIRIRPHSGILFNLKNRARSLFIILLAGLLFFSGLLTEGLQMLVGNYMEVLWPGSGLFIVRGVNEFFFIIIVTIWFTNLFRFLTAGRPQWRLAFFGGFFTSILFTLGKLLLRYLLVQSNIGLIYGTSGSTVLIMLFVFYSALIFYYGGCFVKVLSDEYNQPIRTVKQAFTFELTEVE